MSDIEKDKVRKDIQTYENQGKVNTLSRLGTLAALGAMAHGGFTGNRKTMIGGGLVAAGTGFLSGRSSQKRSRALSRVKKYYDLRDHKLFNMKAVLPNEEAVKTAMLGSLMHAGTALVTAPLAAMQVFQHTGSIGAAATAGAAVVGAHLWPLVADLGATPGLAKWMTSRGLDYAKVFAKQQLKKPLTTTETGMVFAAHKAKDAILAAQKDQSKYLGPLRRYFTGFVRGPAGIGSEIGQHAGEVLEQVGKWSPRHQEMGLEAINSAPAREVLLNSLKKDLKTFNEAGEIVTNTRLAKSFKTLGSGSAPSLKQLLTDVIATPTKAVDMANNIASVADDIYDAGEIIKNTRAARILKFFGRGTAPSLGQFVSDTLKTKGKVVDMAKDWTKTEDQLINAAKAIGAGGATALGSSLLSSYRTGRHPLSKNELPKKLMNT